MRSTARTFAVAAVLANLVALSANVVVAVNGSPGNLALLPVSLFGIGAVVWAWRRHGRNLPTSLDVEGGEPPPPVTDDGRASPRRL